MSPNSSQRKVFFSPEEDRIILDEVAENGDTVSTWRTLTKKLNRCEDTRKSYCSSIRNRFLRLSNSAYSSKGKWTLEEDTALLEHLFTNKPSNIDTIKSISYSSFANTEINRRKELISFHFEAVLKPILQNYHYGTLNSNWKYNFFLHIVNKNYKSLKEVIWEESLNLFLGQTQRSLSEVLSKIVTREQKLNKNLNFCDAVKEHARKVKNVDDYTERTKEYRQKVVDVYLKCAVPAVV